MCLVSHRWLCNYSFQCLFCLLVGEIEEAFKLSPEAFRERYGAVKPSMEDSNIVFHCRAGIRSRTAMTTVHELGYSK